ncbi:hypothetical protein PCASD_15247 [Puccinia coronata f. sp. avenae]|uniref:Uncharacterized protein n=1 Tax=Puccinia coronata f. sp. avenae TaxID=200324 RepID=A0A2N5TC74_9BASI|nr:hypothetical protein PCASD_15247 [Puccinia coronata f. sp. avenae]
MEASSGRFEIEAPIGRLMAASSGHYLTGAPVGRHHKASSGRSCQVAPIGRCHQASNGCFNLKAPTGRFHGASNGLFQGEAANGHAADPQLWWVQVVGSTLAEIILPRLSSPSSFHQVWTGLKPSIGRFRDASWTLRLDGKQIRPVRGQPRDGSQATKFWTTNGRPEVRPLVVRQDPWCSCGCCNSTVTQGSLDQPGRPHDSTYGSDTRTELLPPNRRLRSQPRHLGANMTALTSYGHIVVIVTRIACTFNSCKMVGVRMAPAHLYLPAGKCIYVVAMAPDHDQKGRNAGASLTLGCGVSAPVLLTASFVAPASGRVTGADL